MSVPIPNPAARLAAATMQQVPSAERALPKSPVKLPVSLQEMDFSILKEGSPRLHGRDFLISLECSRLLLRDLRPGTEEQKNDVKTM